MVEGVRLVNEALKAGQAKELILSEESSFTTAGNHRVTWVSTRIIRVLSETESSQGVMAVCSATPVKQPEQLPGGVWIAVDNLSDPGNLGTIIRTAWGTGMAGVILLGEAVDPFNSKVVRASMGGIFHIPVVEGSYEDLARWQAAGHQLIVATAGARLDYWEADYNQDLILVVGSEAHGVSAEVEEFADIKVRLPLEPGVDSINAAVCAGVIMYEIKRQFR